MPATLEADLEAYRLLVTNFCGRAATLPACRRLAEAGRSLGTGM